MRLAPKVDKLVSVEGVIDFIEVAKKKITTSNVIFIHSMFEDISFNEEFDYIVANFIFEHVKNVDDILLKCHAALKKDGLLFTAVPNAEAFSRQMAVEMEIMKSIYDLTENDLSYGHRRVYSLAQFEEQVSRNGFLIVESGGLFVKPFADFQMRAMMDAGIIQKEQLGGLIKMAKRYPELAGSIYIVARKDT